MGFVCVYAPTEEKTTHKYVYETPNGFGNIIMNSDGEFLTTLCFEVLRDISKLTSECDEKLLPIFKDTVKRL